MLADRTQLDQVITNLIENALRHALGSEEIRVSGVLERRQEHGDDRCQRYRSGFTPAAKDRAFTFFQPSGATESKASDWPCAGQSSKHTG